jgi:hypothetical protein
LAGLATTPGTGHAPLWSILASAIASIAGDFFFWDFRSSAAHSRVRVQTGK